MKRSKKGISLAFVIVVVMALMIFSAMLFSAASHSMSMTGESTDGRQAYLTAKSAIEYAKSEAYDQAKAGELKPFAVSQDAGGAFTDVPNIDPNLGIYKNLDGTTNYATCTNPGGDGVSWKITAKVKYKNSAQYRQLAYNFKLQYGESTLGAVNSYVAVGNKVGGTEYLSNDGQFEQSLNYPVVITRPVYTNGLLYSFPEIYFLDSGTCFTLKGGGSVSMTLQANLLYFNGSISSGSTTISSGPSNQTHLYLANRTADNLNEVHLTNGYSGIVWFHNTTIVAGNVFSYKMPDGAYYFKPQTDLFDFATISLRNGNLKKVPDIDLKTGSTATQSGTMPLSALAANVAYFQQNSNTFRDSGQYGTGVNWTDEGHIQTSYNNNGGVFDSSQYHVGMYVDDNYNGIWQNYTGNGNLVYKAQSINLQKMSVNPSFILPKTPVIFQTKVFWFNMQSNQGYPWADANAGDIPTIQAANEKSQFVLSSSDNSPVTLILPHGLKIVDTEKNSYSIAVDFTKGYLNDSDFTYTVKSGTDLLKLPLMTEEQRAQVLKKGSSGSGGSGGSGTFTITHGKYTGS